MVPASDDVDVPADAAAVANRYKRVERPISFAWALLVAAVAVAPVFALPLVWGTLVAVAVILAFRGPLFRTDGTVRLVTDTGLESARADFQGACPPPLALQWGLADAVRSTGDGAAYEFSYLFGTRAMTMKTALRFPSNDDEGTDCAGVTPDGGATSDFELVVTTGGKPWATYAVSIGERDGKTTVEVSMESDRRFGFRSLLQWLVARHYRTTALEAQGYTVVERDSGLSLR